MIEEPYASYYESLEETEQAEITPFIPVYISEEDDFISYRDFTLPMEGNISLNQSDGKLYYVTSASQQHQTVMPIQEISEDSLLAMMAEHIRVKKKMNPDREVLKRQNKGLIDRILESSAPTRRVH